MAFQDIRHSRDKLVEEKLYLEEEVAQDFSTQEMVGASPSFAKVLQQIETVAPSDATVLLLGETGTGKELLARAIHERSRRKARTFVKLNCSAIPLGLVESELFGHERGASPGPSPARWAVSNWPTWVPCSWMRSATCPWNSNQNFCAPFRNASLNAWAALRPFESMCG